MLASSAIAAAWIAAPAAAVSDRVGHQLPVCGGTGPTAGHSKPAVGGYAQPCESLQTGDEAGQHAFVRGTCYLLAAGVGPQPG